MTQIQENLMLKKRKLWRGQSFLDWDREGVPPPAKDLLIPPPPLEQFPTPVNPPSNQILSPPPPKVNFSPTKQQFSSYNPIKTVFLAAAIAPTPFLF